MPTVIDLFAGAGGLSLGASRAGFTVGAAVELDSQAIASHIANFPNTVHIQADIMSLNGADILRLANIPQNELVGIIGGPPCQGFSSIGHGDVDDNRNKLFIKFFEIVADLQPAFFLAENVPGIMKEKFTSIRTKAFEKINNYTMLPPISVNASDYGAPTIRTRYFFIGYRDCEKIRPFTRADIEEGKVAVDDKTTVEKALEGLQADIRYTSTFKGTKSLQPQYCDAGAPHIQSDFFSSV